MIRFSKDEKDIKIFIRPVSVFIHEATLSVFKTFWNKNV